MYSGGNGVTGVGAIGIWLGALGGDCILSLLTREDCVKFLYTIFFLAGVLEAGLLCGFYVVIGVGLFCCRLLCICSFGSLIFALFLDLLFFMLVDTLRDICFSGGWFSFGDSVSWFLAAGRLVAAGGLWAGSRNISRSLGRFKAIVLQLLILYSVNILLVVTAFLNLINFPHISFTWW